MKGSQIMDDVRGLNDGLTGYFLEDIFVGQTAVYAKTVTEADVVLFAGISGDNNPVHLNEEFASTTQFKGRIAHGILTASFISTVLGTRLPGPGCIYLSQSLKFLAPVRAGETAGMLDTVLMRIAETLEKDLELRRRIKSAMTYPVVVLVLAVAGLAIGWDVPVHGMLGRVRAPRSRSNRVLEVAAEIGLRLRGRVRPRLRLVKGQCRGLGQQIFLRILD